MGVWLRLFVNICMGANICIGAHIYMDVQWNFQHAKILPISDATLWSRSVSAPEFPSSVTQVRCLKSLPSARTAASGSWASVATARTRKRCIECMDIWRRGERYAGLVCRCVLVSCVWTYTFAGHAFCVAPRLSNGLICGYWWCRVTWLYIPALLQAKVVQAVGGCGMIIINKDVSYPHTWLVWPYRLVHSYLQMLVVFWYAFSSLTVFLPHFDMISLMYCNVNILHFVPYPPRHLFYQYCSYACHSLYIASLVFTHFTHILGQSSAHGLRHQRQVVDQRH